MNKHPHWHHCPSHNEAYGCPIRECDLGPVIECPPCSAVTLRELRQKNVPRHHAKPRKKQPVDESISAVMREMGRRGGEIGGKRRMETLTPEQRSELARAAAKARWQK